MLWSAVPKPKFRSRSLLLSYVRAPISPAFTSFVVYIDFHGQIRLGKGEKLKDIVSESSEVCEGVDTAFSLEKVIMRMDKSYRKDLKFPIILGVCQVRRSHMSHMVNRSVLSPT